MAYLTVVVVIGFLILFHEIGHLVVGKWIRLPILRFSVGFGPRIWGFRIGETEYRISLFPFGGYVLPKDNTIEAYHRIPLFKRAGFALGGPLMNLFAAFILLWVGTVTSSGFSVSTVSLLPMMELGRLTAFMISLIPTLFTNPGELSGIVGIVAEGGNYIGLNAHRIIELAVILNLNLAILNLLPLPPLDGGKILMCVLEKIYLPFRRLHAPLAIFGWTCLVGIMAYATVLDIIKMTNGLNT